MQQEVLARSTIHHSTALGCPAIEICVHGCTFLNAPRIAYKRVDNRRGQKTSENIKATHLSKVTGSLVHDQNRIDVHLCL